MKTRDKHRKYKWSKLIPNDLDNLILNCAPTKVKHRYIKAKYHYEKALKIANIDPEMSIIRLVAAEEELVVGIFEILKIKKINNIEFVKKFKNHQVKISFAPILVFLVKF